MVADGGIKTFLIADVRGYTRFTQQRGDEAAAQLASRFAELARAAIEAGGGTLLELRGDEAVGVFESARGAIRTAVELQRQFVDQTIAEPSLPLAVSSSIKRSRSRRCPSPSGSGSTRARRCRSTAATAAVR